LRQLTAGSSARWADLHNFNQQAMPRMGRIALSSTSKDYLHKGSYMAVANTLRARWWMGRLTQL